MRTKKASRYNSQQEHNQYGIYNWFKLSGVDNKDIIQETIHRFCQDNGFDMEGFKFSGAKEKSIFNWVANRFQKFASYASKFLKENNYVPDKNLK